MTFALKLLIVCAPTWFVFRAMARNVYNSGYNPLLPGAVALVAGLTGTVAGLVAGWQFLIS